MEMRINRRFMISALALVMGCVTLNAQTDMTSRIKNPSFESNGLNGWTAKDMWTQGNDAFSIKKGSTYVEKWTASGAAGDGSVSQVISDLEPGKYRLIVAAQNIQESRPTAAQTGACIFANTYELDVTVRKDYTLEFVLVSDRLTIGYRAIGATGNWLAVDNFRLEYIDSDFATLQEAFGALITKGTALTESPMSNAVLQKLQQAIADAQALHSQTTTDGWGAAARRLEEAIQAAETSIDVYSKLKNAIDEAQQILDASEAADKSTLENAIQAANETYTSTTSTDASAQAAIAILDKAIFAFRIETSTGTPPRVTTDARFIKGATWAFGRGSVSGSNILEQGFCWSEDPDPKVTDNRTTEYLEQAGKIYWLRDLKPATIYYMRAYAIKKDYAVGYGNVIKFATVPKGTISHWYNNGGDAAANDRINSAINTAIDYYWNNLTSIHDFGISVTFGSGTPTADCGYGGGMRVGPNEGYQQVGTIMHETLHGIGVGTHGMWWSADMRSGGDRGDWLGDRVTEAVRFWDNNTTGVITGDNTHLWPYGCNGSWEDTHNDNLYCMMGIIAQALNEDGLPGSGAIGYALPYYSFTHEDEVKYYIKSEDTDCGFLTSYLVETDGQKLAWQLMSADEAQSNDAAAWYLTFTPSNQYYQLRNAATGHYITYASNTFKTVNHSRPNSADNLHLMRGRVPVTLGSGSHRVNTRGYYVIHPASVSNPPVMVAKGDGTTAAENFNIAKSATTQRWVLLTADYLPTFDAAAVKTMKSELDQVLAQLDKLAQTPHNEETEGTDETFNTELTAIKAAGETSTSMSELKDLITRARSAANTFLENVSADEQPFDLTYMLMNPDFNSDATTGWTTAAAPGHDYGCAEFYEKTFNYYQTLTDLPIGTYELHVNAFQRPGELGAVYTKYASGSYRVTTNLYLGSESTPIKHICDDAQERPLLSSNDQKLGNGLYVPHSMEGSSKYFAQNIYDNSVSVENEVSGGSLKAGLKCTYAPSYYWTIFDNFRLYFYGKKHEDGIQEMDNGQCIMYNGAGALFDLQGRKVGLTPNPSPKRAGSASGLRPGIYIQNGKKVVVNFSFR